MSPRAAAAAVARSAAATLPAPARTRPAPRRPAPQRRRSGAVTRPRPAVRGGAIALPRPDFVSLLDRILRGPAYIAIVGILLVGIVFFNVDVLELNHGIARTDIRAAQLKRENAALTLQLAQLGSSERIQRIALARGLVLPQPGDVRYLRAHSQDAAHALRVMTAPDSSSVVAPAPTLLSQSSGQSATTTPAQSQTTQALTPVSSAPPPTTTSTTPTTSTTSTTTASPAPATTATTTP